MGKVHYLNSHLQKFKENKITFELDELESIADYENIGESDPKIIKLFVKCFKNKDNYKELLKQLPDNFDNLNKYKLITVYWFAFIVYYHQDNYGLMIGDCLEDIDENVVLLDSPHFCKKVYYYLNSIKILNDN